MKKVYPIIIEKTEKWHIVHVPDLGIGTQGKDLADAIDMAEDAISVVGVSMQDDSRQVPEPNTVKFELENGQILAAARVDFDEYRMLLDDKKENTMVTIRKGIKTLAAKKKINLSKTLEEAILAKV